MSDFPYQRWGDFIVSKIDVQKPTIELACGTGNLTLELHKKGIDIQGMDIDENMLAMARQKAMEEDMEIEFYLQDMIEADLTGFSNVLCPCDGINSLLTESELRMFFKNIALQLTGTLIFDFSTTEKLSSLHNEIYYEDHPDITYFWDSEFDEETDQISLNLTFFEKLKNGHYKREDLSIVQQGLTISYIKALVEDYGFKIEGIYEDYYNKEATNESHRVVFICKK